MSSLYDKIKSLDKRSVTIGIHGAEGEQKKLVRRIIVARTKTGKISKTKYGEIKKKQLEYVNPNLTLEEVAKWNEDGTSKIPQRSFIRRTYRIYKTKIIEKCIDVLENDPINFYDEIGFYVLGLMKNEIKIGIPPPNSPKTVKQKGSSTPEINTGQLFTGLKYEVK